MQVSSWSTVLQAADTSKRIRNDTWSSSIIDKGLSANTNMCCDFCYQVVCKQPCITHRISRELSVALFRKKSWPKVCWHELIQIQHSQHMKSRIIWPSTKRSGIWQKDLRSVSYREEIFKEITKIKLMHVIVWKSVWFKTGIYWKHFLRETSSETLHFSLWNWLSHREFSYGTIPPQISRNSSNSDFKGNFWINLYKIGLF